MKICACDPPAVLAGCTAAGSSESRLSVTSSNVQPLLPSRRGACLSLGAAGLAMLCHCPHADAGSPYQEGKTLQYGLNDERIRPCPGGYNPNCVSTASINDLYAPVWESPEADVGVAAQFLERAVSDTCPDAQLASAKEMPDGQFRAYTVPSLFGRDVMEFLIRKEGSGSNPDGTIVMYRSMAGKVQYIWPLQTPISDFGAQRKRMNAIRGALGWRLMGCELLECYES